MLRASQSTTLTLQRRLILPQLGIVQEAPRVALLKEPSLRQIWPQLDALLAGMKQQQEEGAKLDQKIAENLRRLGYEF